MSTERPSTTRGRKARAARVSRASDAMWRDAVPSAAIEHEAADGEQEDREAALERRLRHARGERASGDRPDHRDRREAERKPRSSATWFA